MSSCSEISATNSRFMAEVIALNNKFATKNELNNYARRSELGRYALKNDLNNYLNKSEKPAIIQQSVMTAEQVLLPGLLIVIGNRVNALLPQIANATATAQKAIGMAGSALEKLAGVAGQISSILVTLATLFVVFARIDALESYIGVVANDVSRAYGVIGTVKARADFAFVRATDALDRAFAQVNKRLLPWN